MNLQQNDKIQLWKTNAAKKLNKNWTYWWSVSPQKKSFHRWKQNVVGQLQPIPPLPPRLLKTLQPPGGEVQSKGRRGNLPKFIGGPWEERYLSNRGGGGGGHPMAGKLCKLVKCWTASPIIILKNLNCRASNTKRFLRLSSKVPCNLRWVTGSPWFFLQKDIFKTC